MIESGLAVAVAGAEHLHHLPAIAAAIEEEVARGSIGLARRSTGWLAEAARAGMAIIAAEGSEWAGFCAIHPWEGGMFVATSALIVRPEFRERGVASRLKEKALELCRKKFPGAIPFGLSTSERVAAINRRLGFREVPYAKITRDPEFWKGCETCPLFATLAANQGKSCHCRAMRL